jgi:hypothetical protein
VKEEKELSVLKKYLSLLLVLMLSIGMLAVAGCGGEKEPSGQDAGQEPAITKLVVGSETAYAPFEMVDEKTGDYIGFDMAMQEELKAAEKYRTLARDAVDTETRLLFEQLAREEDMHYRKLSERLKAIRLMG